MTLGMINANPVVHERPERAAHPHAADALDPLDVFGRVLSVLSSRVHLARFLLFHFCLADGCVRFCLRYGAGHQGPGAPVLPGAAQRAVGGVRLR